MAYHSFEDLEVWKRSVDLSVRIYELFRGCKDYGFKDQICRASVSVSSNISEGMERASVKETIHFLHISKGSCAEIRTQLIIACRISYNTEQECHDLVGEAKSISKMLHGLAVSLNPKT
jgi:four helix bundle protein